MHRGAPKVLVFDIETLPLWVRSWGVGKQYLNYRNIIKDYCILSWSAKWLFDRRVMAEVLTPEEALQRNDLRILEPMWKLLDEADVIITQNGIRFDVKKLNTRFVYWGMNPYSPFHHIDTRQAADAAFGLSSASLDYATDYLGLARKLETDYQLWIDCDNGDAKALDKMLEYNKNDIWILEDYYARIRAWIPKHPNFSAYTSNYLNLKDGETLCPVCRGAIEPESSLSPEYRTPLGLLYKSFSCPHCGAQGRYNKKAYKGQKVLTRPVR